MLFEFRLNSYVVTVKHASTKSEVFEVHPSLINGFIVYTVATVRIFLTVLKLATK